jgi:hypothetical protein
MPLPTVGESREALRLGSELGAGEVIRRAYLRVRCQDCSGQVIAAVAVVRGRPLIAMREQNDRLAPERRLPRHWQYAWYDRGGVFHARCRQTRHVLRIGKLPARGEHRVSHTP